MRGKKKCPATRITKKIVKKRFRPRKKPTLF